MLDGAHCFEMLWCFKWGGCFEGNGKMFLPSEYVSEGDGAYSTYYLNAYSETEENQEEYRYK